MFFFVDISCLDYRLTQIRNLSNTNIIDLLIIFIPKFSWVSLMFELSSLPRQIPSWTSLVIKFVFWLLCAKLFVFIEFDLMKTSFVSCFYWCFDTLIYSLVIHSELYSLWSTNWFLNAYKFSGNVFINISEKNLKYSVGSLLH